MAESRWCWIDKGKECSCHSNVECEVLKDRYSHVLYCNRLDCKFNKELPESILIPPGGSGVSALVAGTYYKAFNDDGNRFKGVCDCPLPVTLSPLKTKDGEKRRLYDVAVCNRYANKHGPSHMRFPDPDKLQGGNIPDPPSPDWVASAPIMNV